MSNAFYRVIAIPEVVEVRCPKHTGEAYMRQLRNGIFGEDLWWCKHCECPYYLKPAKLKEFDRAEVDRQLQEQPK